jgi:hypothetical protein
MEVHAHTHTSDPDSHRGRKKWTHYFWEFLMLFLAVFCGFLAENQREHYVEAQRAKDYARSLVNDLKDDTAEVKSAIDQTNFIASALDSTVSIVLRNEEWAVLPGSFYYYARFCVNLYTIDWSKSSITQLVQSGNLRYFKNKDLVNKINKYYALQQLITSQNQTDKEIRLMIFELRNRILNGRYYNSFSRLSTATETYGHIPDKGIDSLMTLQLPLQTGAEKLMLTFINHLSDRKVRLTFISESYYKKAITEAKDITNLLKKEYHLQ